MKKLLLVLCMSALGLSGCYVKSQHERDHYHDRNHDHSECHDGHGDGKHDGRY